jgi:UDP-N-acetylglucosamine--N-acetylmuramyl-(pentapeptide) pyrophosphoryl-undecaprenol N-acetylglucosamine transferase
VPHDIYIFAGGGTGGHLYPGLAVAEELLRLLPGAGIVFACSYRAIDRKILDGTPYAVVPQPIRPAPRLGGLWTFLRSYVHSARQSRDMIADLKPAAVLGLGGFAAVPLVQAAHKAGVPAGFLNPDAVPGKANRFLARRSDAIFAQFESAPGHFPEGVRSRVRPVGCPIRKEFFDVDRDAALRELDLKSDRKTLLVNGGSLGAQSINEAVLQLVPELDALADRWQVLHVTGPGKGGGADLIQKTRRISVRSMEYCRRMDLALAAADLALCRAGASTVAELCAVGRPAIILPYPYHRDQHQRLNALALVEAGAAELVEDRIDPAANAASLREKLLPLLTDEGRLETMRRASAGLGKPRAAAEVAHWLASKGRRTGE